MNDNIKYSVTLGLLMGLTVMMPSFREAFVGTSPTIAEANTAATLSAMIVSNVDLIKCPVGRTCSGSSEAVPGVYAKTTDGASLTLTYDSSKREALLTAKFTINVYGGDNGFYLYPYPYIGFRNSSGQVFYVNTQKTQSLIPISNITKATDLYGQTIYFVPAKSTVKFSAIATVDPKSLFAGKYYAAVDGLLGYVSPTSTNIIKIGVNSDNTNIKTIIGEITPYISSLAPQQAKAGDSVTITGQRLNLGEVYIDNLPLSSYAPNVPTTVKVDGTGLGFTIPNLSTSSKPNFSPGWHVVTVSSPNGMSNGVGLQVLAPVSQDVVISNFSTNYGTLNISQTGMVSQMFSFKATITAGNHPIFLSTNGTTAFPMKVVSSSGFSISPLSFVDDNTSGDTPSYMYVAPGQSKTFTADYLAKGMSNQSAQVYVLGLNYGTSTPNLAAVLLDDVNMQNSLKAVLFH